MPGFTAPRAIVRWRNSASARSSNFAPGAAPCTRMSRSWMRYLTPLLPRGEIFHSKASSKSPNVSSVGRSSRTRAFGTARMHPSSTVQASPGGFSRAGSSQPLSVLPSNSNRHPAAFSSRVSAFGVSAASTLQARAQAAAAAKAEPYISSYCSSSGAGPRPAAASQAALRRTIRPRIRPVPHPSGIPSE